MKVWIVEDINGETVVAQTATVAYNICRKSISENEDDDEAAAEEFLNELAHSYSDSRASFGVESVIWARAMDVISE